MYTVPTRRPGADVGRCGNGEANGDCTALPSRRGLILATSSFQVTSPYIVHALRTGTLAIGDRTRDNIKGCQLLNVVVNLRDTIHRHARVGIEFPNKGIGGLHEQVIENQ